MPAVNKNYGHTNCNSLYICDFLLNKNMFINLVHYLSSANIIFARIWFKNAIMYLNSLIYFYNDRGRYSLFDFSSNLINSPLNILQWLLHSVRNTLPTGTGLVWKALDWGLPYDLDKPQLKCCRLRSVRACSLNVLTWIQIMQYGFK